MKRSEVQEGALVWCGHRGSVRAWKQAVVHALDTRLDNGYRVELEMADGSGYVVYPLHSIYSETERLAALAALEAEEEAARAQQRLWAVEVDTMREDASFLLKKLGVSVVVVPDYKTGQHVARLSASDLGRITASLL